MLILYRKKGESIVIGDDITISVVESNADGVRLSIDAPREIPIMRKELIDAATANREATETDQDALSKMKAMLVEKERKKKKKESSEL